MFDYMNKSANGLILCNIVTTPLKLSHCTSVLEVMWFIVSDYICGSILSLFTRQKKANILMLLARLQCVLYYESSMYSG